MNHETVLELLPPPYATPAFSSLGLDSSALLDLQLEVARRADELARWVETSRWHDRRVWLRAEQEIFERAEAASAPSATARAHSSLRRDPASGDGSRQS